MTNKQKLKFGDEYDAICSRPLHHWAGKRLKKIKRALNKRFRKEAKRNQETH